MNQDTRPWYFWPVIAFLVGLLFGWLVIGWLVWPVEWTNAQPADLRPDLRYEYVAMVAESYGQTGNLEQARTRLAGWDETTLARDLSEAQGVLVARNNIATAQRLQELSVALGANAAAQGGQDQAQAPAAQPTAAAAESGSSVSNLRQICTAGLFIGLALGALALLVFLFRKWRASASGQAFGQAPAAYEDFDAVDAAEPDTGRWPAAQSFDEEERPSRGGFAATPVRPYMVTNDDAPVVDAYPTEPPVVPLRPVSQAPSDIPRNETARTEPPRSEAPAARPAPASAGSLKKLVESTAVYQMGEPDYDEAFDISDPSDGFMGQFGLQLIEPFGRERDQAVALQVWLWDSSDPDTQAMVLMSEGAYRDTALRSQHAGEHQALSVRPGAEFELASHDLLLKGRVEKVSYAEAEPPRGIFADLHVKLTVYRRV
jgi:hypothetical protein